MLFDLVKSTECISMKMYFNENGKDINTQNNAYFMHSIETLIGNCEQNINLLYRSELFKEWIK